MYLHPSAYPLRGILFFLTHPSLWTRLLCGLLLSLLFSLTSTILLFTFALAPQARALDTHLPSWLSWLISVILILLEIFMSCFLFFAIVLPTVADQVFDDTLSLQTGQDTPGGSCARGCWLSISHFGIYLFYLFFLRLVVLIVTAPFNLIPVFGTLFFFALNGYLSAWSQHLHWFELRKWGFGTGHAFVKSHRPSYVAFGAAAIALEMIPVVGMIFMFTNTVGAALWAVDLEKQGIMPGPIRRGSSSAGTIV
ncbi:hypothetical protein DFS34DRAFT_613992 [Phlyctochytrium arcticum]|nr:hypothetical protein DFS34DRAFT_613992 [Phlyctochytrium arcticum]